SYFRRAPWEYLGSDFPISIELGEQGPQPDVKTLYAVVLGNGGTVFGVALYYSMEGFRRALQQGAAQIEQDDLATDDVIEALRQAGAPVDAVPPEMLRMMVADLIEEQGLPAMDEAEYMKTLQDALLVYFDFEEESDPTYLEWLDERKLKYATPEAVPTFQRLVAGKGAIEP